MCYLVAYARLVLNRDRDRGVALHGDTIYFAGIAFVKSGDFRSISG